MSAGYTFCDLFYIARASLAALPAVLVLCCIGAPAHWRMRAEAAAAAAADGSNNDAAAAPPGLTFEGLRVVFYGSSDAPSFDTLAHVLKAGGGKLLRRSPPYSAVLPDAAAAAAAGGSSNKGGAGKRGSKVAAAAAEATGAAATVDGDVANLAVIGPDKDNENDK